MAVFTSSITRKEDAKNAILIDVKMTHPDKLVQEAILTYELAIHYLLNHPDDQFKAKQAFDQALEESKQFKTYQDDQGRDQSVQIWLKIAIHLNQITQKNKTLLIKPIPATLLNCRNAMGWLQKAFVLSFYYLLRHDDYK